MATKAYYPIEEIGKGKPGFSKTRSITKQHFMEIMLYRLTH